MENTLENKAKFFAQYWGSPIIHTGTGRSMRGIKGEMIMSYENSDKFQLILFSTQRSLLLKRVENISDLEAKKYLTYVGVNCSVKKCKEFLIENCNDSLVCDFIRSWGYALPWMGLSVDQLVEYGWVKLT